MALSDAKTELPSAPAATPRPTVSIVVPCMNEEESLPDLLQKLDATVKTLAGRNQVAEVIIVDDGSKDRSLAILKEATATRPYLRVLRFARNFGQTAAMAAGFDAAVGDVMIPLDADLQNDPDDIPMLLDKLDEGFDVVSGWRHNRQDDVTRTLPSRIANGMISYISGVRLHDYGCTLKAYRRSALEGVNLYGEMHRFIPIYSAQQGARITEVKVKHHPRTKGKTKYGLGRIPNVLLDLLLVQFLWRYGTKPIHVFGKFGLLNLLGSIVAFLGMIYFKFWGGKPFVETPLPLLSIMFFLIGSLSVLMGLLAEMTMRTYYESRNASIYRIREVYRDGQTQPPPTT